MQCIEHALLNFIALLSDNGYGAPQNSDVGLCELNSNLR